MNTKYVVEICGNRPTTNPLEPVIILTVSMIAFKFNKFNAVCNNFKLQMTSASSGVF